MQLWKRKGHVPPRDLSFDWAFAGKSCDKLLSDRGAYDVLPLRPSWSLMILLPPKHSKRSIRAT